MGFFSGLKKLFKKVAPIAIPIGVGLLTGGVGGGVLSSLFGSVAPVLHTPFGIIAGQATPGLFGTAFSSALGKGSGLSNFVSNPLGSLFKVAGSAAGGTGGGTGPSLGSIVNAFGTFSDSRQTAATFDANANIALANAGELLARFDEQILALGEERESISSAAAIQEREIVEGRARAKRTGKFSQDTILSDRAFNLTRIESETAFSNERIRAISRFNRASIDRATDISQLTRSEITERHGLADQQIAATMGIINTRSDEVVRSLRKQRQEIIGDFRATAAASGLRQRGSVVDVRDDIFEEGQFAISLTEADRRFALADAKLRDQAEDSETREALARLDFQLEETVTSQEFQTGETIARQQFQTSETLAALNDRLIDLEETEREITQGLEDAFFDAALESEINVRNRDIAIAQSESQERILTKRKDFSPHQPALV